MTNYLRRMLVALGLCGLLSTVASQAAPAPTTPFTIQLPSEAPSGDVINDLIWVTFYPAEGVAGPAPAVVLLHPIGEDAGDLSDRFMHRLARQMSDRGIACALMTLPYHSQRHALHTDALPHFIGPKIDDVLQALSQSRSDVSTVTTWLSRRPDVDPQRLGVVGLSLGAIIAHLAMGQDARLKAGVALEGGGNLPNLYKTSAEVILHGHPSGQPLTAADLARLRAVDPAQYAGANRPRRVLMIEATRDLYVPAPDATYLWNALGHPPIQWVDTNHFGFTLSGNSLAKTATAYLDGVWDGRPDSAIHTPLYRAPTLKLGWIVELSPVNTTPALQWEFLKFGSRADHLPLLHLNLGESGRGPFLGLATTLNTYTDLGVLQRIRGHPTPYLSVHLVY